jgi:hypothetical protein
VTVSVPGSARVPVPVPAPVSGVPPMPAGPAYADGSLADVMPSIAAALGVPEYADRLGLSEAVGKATGGALTHAVVLLVDGLGWELLCANRDAAPFLSNLIADGRSITVGFPSTTATSMASLGTGEQPGVHGLVGYTFALPGIDGVFNALRWDRPVNPTQVQPHPTVFERAARAGVRVTHVAQRAFDGSGLTRAALRGPEYGGAETMGESVHAAAVALATRRPALVYVYTGDLDNVGHVRGCRSMGWRAQLGHVDLLARDLHAALPPGAALVITADHGMVDVPADDRIDYDTDPVLSAGVQALGGEPRARHVYARPGAAADVLAAWRERTADRLWVVSREEAIDAGWFGGIVRDEVVPRIGDVIAAAQSTFAVVATKNHPREARLVGYHGSLTSAELLVPLLIAPARN